MAARSFACILMMMCLFAPLQNRIGTRRTYQVSMLAWPLTILFFPILNLLKRWEASELVMNIALCTFFVVWGLAHISWRKPFGHFIRWNILTLINSGFFSVDQRCYAVCRCTSGNECKRKAAPISIFPLFTNLLQGISQMAIVLPQAIAPAFVTSLFAWSITSHILGGYLIWIILFGIGKSSSSHR